MTDHPGPDALDSLTLDWLRMVRLAQSALSHATAPCSTATQSRRRSMVDHLPLALGEELDTHTAVILARDDRRGRTT